MSTVTSRHELRRVNVAGERSLIMVIPKYMCDHLGISKGDYLDIRLRANTIVVKKLKEQAS